MLCRSRTSGIALTGARSSVWPPLGCDAPGAHSVAWRDPRAATPSRDDGGGEGDAPPRLADGECLGRLFAIRPRRVPYVTAWGV